MSDEESTSHTTLAVLGGIGCVLALIVVPTFLFLGVRFSSGPTGLVSPSAPPSTATIEAVPEVVTERTVVSREQASLSGDRTREDITYSDGTRRIIVRGAGDGESTGRFVHYASDGTVDREQTGVYTGGTRTRGLADDEITQLVAEMQ